MQEGRKETSFLAKLSPVPYIANETIHHIKSRRRSYDFPIIHEVQKNKRKWTKLLNSLQGLDFLKNELFPNEVYFRFTFFL